MVFLSRNESQTKTNWYKKPKMKSVRYVGIVFVSAMAVLLGFRLS
jgi:hypothetical protein